MTRSSGGSRQPNRPYKDGDSRRDPRAANPDRDFDDNNNSGSASKSRPARRQSSPQPQESETTYEPIDPKKRGIALMGDIIVAFAASLVIVPIVVVINFIVPHIAKIVNQQMICIAVLLVRDYFYQGRGFGKNLMGLQVVDFTTGQPPSLLQSIKRNILFYIPSVVIGIVSIIKFLPFGGSVNIVVFQAVYWICTAYVILLIPAECWFALKGEGGRRLGDKFANTVIVESSMDFSKPV